jgi:hypothetical protein
MPKDRGEEKVETGGKVTIKAELFDEVLKERSCLWETVCHV